MRIIFRTIFGLAISLLASETVLAAGAAKQLPARIKLQSLGGAADIQRADLKGKAVVMLFFASWCKGCADVMAQMSPIVSEVPNARFLPVSLDESMDDAHEYFGRQRDSVKALEKTAAFDRDAKLATVLGVEALPAIVVVDASGKVLYSLAGHPDAAQTKKIVKLIGGKP